jgi:hypothetical protein
LKQPKWAIEGSGEVVINIVGIVIVVIIVVANLKSKER